MFALHTILPFILFAILQITLASPAPPFLPHSRPHPPITLSTMRTSLSLLLPTSLRQTKPPNPGNCVWFGSPNKPAIVTLLDRSLRGSTSGDKLVTNSNGDLCYRGRSWTGGKYQRICCNFRGEGERPVGKAQIPHAFFSGGGAITAFFSWKCKISGAGQGAAVVCG